MFTKRRITTVVAAFMLIFVLLGNSTFSADASGYDYNVGYDLYPHYVSQGETLSMIADAYGTTVNEILSFNAHIWNAHHIYAGDTITVPVPVGNITNYDGGEYHPTGPAVGEYHPEPPCRAYHHVSAGDTLSGLAMWYGSSVYDIAAANGIYYYNWIYAGQVLCIPW